MHTGNMNTTNEWTTTTNGGGTQLMNNEIKPNYDYLQITDCKIQ